MLSADFHYPPLSCQKISKKRCWLLCVFTGKDTLNSGCLSQRKREDVKSIYGLDKKLNADVYLQRQISYFFSYFFFSGPRLRQHHSHHQKPSVERHWVRKWRWTLNREKYQWLSAPVCQGRNVWNQTETAHQTMNWPPSLIVKYGSILSRLRKKKKHISYSYLNSLSLSLLTDNASPDGFGLYSEIHTAKGFIFCVG